jgi:outer membrane biosynthesis protein TonB
VKEAVSDILAARAQDAGGIHRLFAYSLGIHLLIGVAAVLMPADWLSNQAARPNVMEVSLGGSLGERTTGVAPIAGRRVEQAVPEPKRPEPLKVAPPPKADTMPTPAAKVVTPPKTPPKPLEKPLAAATTARPKPPVTGKQVQAGTAVTDTGATGLGQGLTQGGGGGTGGVVDLNVFDQAWVSQMTNAITAVWDNAQPETGWTEILFELNRDGKVITFQVTASTQSFVLNTAAERAVKMATIAPLPRDFKEDTLRVRLRFNYKGR